jgi:hypothetical protein
MANSNQPRDPNLSNLRRRLVSAKPEAAKLPPLPNDPTADSVDFDAVENGANAEKPASRVPIGYDEVEALLQRYQTEKGKNGSAEQEVPVLPPLNGLRRAAASSQQGQHPAPAPLSGSSHQGTVRPTSGSRQGLPPLVMVNGQGSGEWDKLRSENAELRAMVAELRQYLEENDPQAWEERIRNADAALAEREELLTEQKKLLDEWQEKLQTHRFVPSDDDVAVMADDVEKERCQLTQERKKLDDDRRQLEEDEEALMKQMREMEVAMAKERAELARQRTDLQRLHADVKHEMELLQRGDGAMKERLAQFQRRHSDVMRPVDLPRQSPTPAAPYQAPAPSPSRASQPRQSGVFKRFFGQE